MVYLIIFFLILTTDQLSKLLVDAYVGDGKITVWEHVFSIVNTRNSGAAFSMLGKEDWAQIFFIAITVVAVVFALVYLIFSKKTSKWLNVTITLILAGAIGNFIDRLAFKEVRDFLFIEFFANCNVADVAITVGAIMLFVYFLFVSDDPLFGSKKKKEKIVADETEESVDEGN